MRYNNWQDWAFLLALIALIVIAILWCAFTVNPIVEKQIIITCEDAIERENFAMSIAKLEGMVVAMQRMMPVYAGLLISVILFLTWKQQNIAKATAIEEINDNFQEYKERIIVLEEQAKDLVEGIKAKYKTLAELENLPFGEIVSRITERTQDNEQEH